MGFWRSLVTPKADPLVDLVRELVQTQAKSTTAAYALVRDMMESQKVQNETTRQLLNQYMSPGPNTASSLNERLYKTKNIVEWDEIVENPFAGI